MYVLERDVRALTLHLNERFPDCHLVFDAVRQLCPLAASNPTIRFRKPALWFFSQSPDIAQLNWFYPLIFRLTRNISAAQKAQRRW